MKAIVLDMYGVIVKQTGDDFVPYVQQTFPDLNPEEIYNPWFKADIGELTSLEVWEAIGFQGDLEKIEKEYLDTIELMDGFIDFIEKVKDKYKLAIISNDSSRWSKYLREKFDLNKYFDVISISGDLKIQKPDERIFFLTIEKLGLNAEDCIYIDDREGNLEAAKKVGMNPVLLNSRKVSYNGVSVNGFEELVKEILAIGDYLGLPERFLYKEPADGMTGKTDQDILGFTYEELDSYIRDKKVPEKVETLRKIKERHRGCYHKRGPVPVFYYYDPDDERIRF